MACLYRRDVNIKCGGVSDLHISYPNIKTLHYYLALLPMFFCVLLGLPRNSSGLARWMAVCFLCSAAPLDALVDDPILCGQH